MADLSCSRTNRKRSSFATKHFQRKSLRLRVSNVCWNPSNLKEMSHGGLCLTASPRVRMETSEWHPAVTNLTVDIEC